MHRLGTRQLNRASLDRQLLLDRVALPVCDAVQRLAGMQGQAPNAPYVGLWSRLAGFRHDELADALEHRQLVRAALMRATIHLVTAADALAWGALTRPVAERALLANWRRRLTGIDLTELVAISGSLLAERPMTRAELAAALAETWPDGDGTAMAYAATSLVPVVQVPPRGVWGRTGQATWTTTSAWLSGPGAVAEAEDLVTRFLRAFGPASVRDMQTWSGLTRLREVVERLDLRGYRDEHGTELFDLPDAVLPDPETPAPPRFLPEYDNLLLAYADRTRVAAEHRTIPLPPGIGGVCGTLLVDGAWRGTWRLARNDDGVTLVIEPFWHIEDPDPVVEEGARLLTFVAAGADHDVVVLEEAR
jgi:hypothetical protein